jgi:hypothetical protein
MIDCCVLWEEFIRASGVFARIIANFVGSHIFGEENLMSNVLIVDLWWQMGDEITIMNKPVVIWNFLQHELC